MFFSFGSKILALLVVAWAGLANAQLTYLPSDQILASWTGSASPVGPGNGAFTSPDGSYVVVTSRDGSAKAFAITSGAVLWTYTPPSATATSTSGVFFSYSAATPYLCFSYSDSNTTSIVALSPSGDVILTAGPVPGVAVGTPVTSEDGEYIITNVNNGDQGVFVIFEISEPSTPLYTYSHPTIRDEPFGAIGYYWSPAEGNYPEGALNTNDIFIWNFDTNLVKTNGTVGNGTVFAFQMPTNPMSALNVTIIGGTRDFQAKLPPILTDGGLSMYWSVTRSRVYAWMGDGSNRLDFGTNGIENVGYTRGDPDKSASANAPPTLSSANGTEGFVVGPTANTEIFRMDRNFSDAPGVVIPTATVISSRLLVSPDDLFVYYATQSADNSLYQIDSTTLTQVWKLALAAGIEGDIAMSKNGASIIVADNAGVVTSFVVATAGPTAPPVTVPMSAPAGTPVGSPPPSDPASLTPSDIETMSPAGTSPTAPTAPTAPVPAPVRPPSSPTVPVTTPTGSAAVSQFVFSMISATILATMMAFMM